MKNKMHLWLGILSGIGLTVLYSFINMSHIRYEFEKIKESNSFIKCDIDSPRAGKLVSLGTTLTQGNYRMVLMFKDPNAKDIDYVELVNLVIKYENGSFIYSTNNNRFSLIPDSETHTLNLSNIPIYDKGEKINVLFEARVRKKGLFSTVKGEAAFKSKLVKYKMIIPYDYPYSKSVIN